jgi:dihydroorotate dehydrogenase (NAD+) catalytic subunit
MNGARRAPSPDRLAVQIGQLKLANPVMPASGCFGPELSGLIAIHELGAVVTKTIFAATRSGNPAHRLAEVEAGMLNSVGIPSPGIDRFRAEILPAYRELGPPVIVSIGGLSVQEYLDVAAGLTSEDFDAIEINVSCPNLGHGGLEIGSDARTIDEVTRGVKERASGRPVIVKLTPNSTSVPELGQSAEAAGADALTVANTLVGMSIDPRTRMPSLGSFVGGLSGPAVRPVIVRMVWQTARAVQIPVIACGGISSADNVVEYLMAGASAVQVGTATFTRPPTMVEILRDLPGRLDQLGEDRFLDGLGSVGTERQPEGAMR